MARRGVNLVARINSERG